MIFATISFRTLLLSIGTYDFGVNAPGSSLRLNVGALAVWTRRDPAHSRQSDRRGYSAQSPSHGRLSAVSLA